MCEDSDYNVLSKEYPVDWIVVGEDDFFDHLVIEFSPEYFYGKNFILVLEGDLCDPDVKSYETSGLKVSVEEVGVHHYAELSLRIDEELVKNRIFVRDKYLDTEGTDYKYSIVVPFGCDIYFQVLVINDTGERELVMEGDFCDK